MRVTGHPYSSDYSVPEFLIIITRSPSVLYYEITCGLYSVTHLFGLFVVVVVHNLNNSDIVHPVKWFSLVLRYNFKVK